MTAMRGMWIRGKRILSATLLMRTSGAIWELMSRDNTRQEVRYDDRNDDRACGTGILREFMFERQIGFMQDIEKIKRQNFVTTANPR
jgi:hypothetical protein